MARRREQRDYGATSRGLSQLDPADPVGNFLVSAAVDGGGWLFGRLLDWLRGRQKPSDPTMLPVAGGEEPAPSGNVRVVHSPDRP